MEDIGGGFNFEMRCTTFLQERKKQTGVEMDILRDSLVASRQDSRLSLPGSRFNPWLGNLRSSKPCGIEQPEKNKERNTGIRQHTLECLGSRMYLIPISRDHLSHQTDERCILVMPKMTQNYLFNPNFKIALLSYMHYI